jgi:hypothetical protein
VPRRREPLPVRALEEAQSVQEEGRESGAHGACSPSRKSPELFGARPPRGDNGSIGSATANLGLSILSVILKGPLQEGCSRMGTWLSAAEGRLCSQRLGWDGLKQFAQRARPLSRVCAWIGRGEVLRVNCPPKLL